MTYQSCVFYTRCTYFPAAAAEHGCCAAAAASRRRELRLMTDVAEPCAPFPLQLHHANLQLNLLPLPLPLTDTDSTTVLDANVFSPLHEFGASCPLPKIAAEIELKCFFYEFFFLWNFYKQLVVVFFILQLLQKPGRDLVITHSFSLFNNYIKGLGYLQFLTFSSH